MSDAPMAAACARICGVVGKRCGAAVRRPETAPVAEVPAPMAAGAGRDWRGGGGGRSGSTGGATLGIKGNDVDADPDVETDPIEAALLREAPDDAGGGAVAEAVDTAGTGTPLCAGRGAPLRGTVAGGIGGVAAKKSGGVGGSPARAAGPQPRGDGTTMSTGEEGAGGQGDAWVPAAGSGSSKEIGIATEEHRVAELLRRRPTDGAAVLAGREGRVGSVRGGITRAASRDTLQLLPRSEVAPRPVVPPRDEAFDAPFA